MSKWIQIWYSRGDMDYPVKVPNGVDEWECMKKIVAEEVFAAQDQEEYPEGCGVWAYAEEGKVVLEYYGYNERCYYLITDTEDYDPFNKLEEE